MSKDKTRVECSQFTQFTKTETLPAQRKVVRFRFCVMLNQLVDCPWNMREDLGDTERLGNSISEDGQHQDLEVRPARGTPEGEIAYTILNDPEASPADLQLAEKKGKYEVVIGKRRFHSAQARHVEQLDISIRPNMTDLEALDASLENDYHKTMTDYEKGKTFKTAMEKFPQVFPNQAAVAKHYHYEQSSVSHCIDHYEFMQQSINSPKNMGRPIIPPQAIALSSSITEAIRKAPEELQPKLFEKAIKGELTVKEARIIAEQTSIPEATPQQMIQTLAQDTALRNKIEDSKKESLVKKFAAQPETVPQPQPEETPTPAAAEPELEPETSEQPPAAEEPEPASAVQEPATELTSKKPDIQDRPPFLSTLSEEKRDVKTQQPNTEIPSPDPTTVNLLPAKTKQVLPKCPVCGYEGAMINGARQAYPSNIVEDVVEFFGSMSEAKLQKILRLTTDEAWKFLKDADLSDEIFGKAAKRHQSKEAIN
jgi:hypothetical protein